MKFALLSLGYYDGPQFPDYNSARKALKEIVKDSLDTCRSRYGEGKKVMMGKDSYKIVFGANIWSAHWIRVN